MSKRLNMSNDEAVEWLLSLKNLDICGENRKTAIDKAVTALKAQPTRVNETYLSIKDAISELKAMREHIVGYMSIVGTTAYDMGIEALEAQPCIEDYPTCTECEHYDSEKHYCPRFCQVIKDTLAEAQPSEDTEVIKVSKRAVKARQGRFVIYDVDWFKEHFYSEEMIYGQPKQPSEDCISREAVLRIISKEEERDDDNGGCWIPDSDNVIWNIRQLPSVTPQRKRGKWIVISCEPTDIFKCSECGMRVINPYRYCPNCGSYNGGGEDEDSN